MIRLLLTFILLLSLPIQAESLSIKEFSQLLESIQIPASASKKEVLTISAETTALCNRIAEVSELTSGTDRFYVNLFWLNKVIHTINSDISDSKKRLLFANMSDTLRALAEELSAPMAADSFTRQQMLDALERALGKTSVVKVSPAAIQAAEMSWCTGGAYVVDEPGEAISIVQNISSESMGGSATTGTTAGSDHGNTNSPANQAGATTMQGSASNNSTNSQPFQAPTNPQATQNAHNSAPQTQPLAKSDVGLKKAPPPPRPQPVPKVKPPVPPAPKKSADIIFWAILIISAILFAAFIFIAIHRLRQKIITEKSALLLTEKNLPPEKLQLESIYAKAMQAASQENYGEAVRLLTIGALLILEEHRILNFQETMTNGEYLQELLHSKQLHSLFSPPLALFDKLIYGFQNPDKNDFELFRKFYLNLEQSCQ